MAALHPVGVFLAAGAPPVVPKSIPGIDKAVLAEDVILGKAPCTGKVVLVGTLIQDQVNKTHNLPFAAALSVVLMILTSLMISLYKRVTHTTELEGIL